MSGASIYVSSLGVKLKWWVIEGMAKRGFNWLKKKAQNWANKELQSKLNVIDEPRVTLEEIIDNSALLFLGLHLDSKIPSRLCPELVMLLVKFGEFTIDTSWNRRTQELSKHRVNEIEAHGNEWWGFFIEIPIIWLKKRISKKSYVDLKAIFQDELTKTFKEISFKIRDSDAKRIKEID